MEGGLNKDLTVKPSGGGLTCCFRKKHVKDQKKETHDLIVQIFGKKQLTGNLSLDNVIKYNTFCRIDGEIAEKNDKVKTLFNMEIFNGLISIIGPFMFWVTLRHDDKVCITSRVYFGIKVA